MPRPLGLGRDTGGENPLSIYGSCVTRLEFILSENPVELHKVVHRRRAHGHPLAVASRSDPFVGKEG